MVTEEKITEELKSVKDPELQTDIVTLGLIYHITIDEPEGDSQGAEVLMTLTTPFCPFANEIIEGVEKGMERAGVTEPRVEITFDPPWEPPEELTRSLDL